MNRQDIDKFEKTQSQLEGLHKEIGILSRKSPNDSVNKFKLKFINQLLIEANLILINQYKPLAGFEVFDDNDLPFNSDVVMVLEQYLNCMEKLRSDNIKKVGFDNDWQWNTEEEGVYIRTSPPKKIKNK